MGLINLLKKLFQQKKIKKPNGLNIYDLFTQSDKNAIAKTAYRLVEIINESLQIANTTKNIETKISRVRLARQKFNELHQYCIKFPFIKMEKSREVELNIKQFEKEIEDQGDTFSIKFQDDKTYYQNRNIIKGLIFNATLQVRTPLSVLIHHGERFSGPPSKAPKYASEADGFWGYETTTWREPGINMDELSEVEGASDVGPVKANKYLPFLMEFRKIVESQDSVDNKIKKIKELGNINKLFNYFINKLNGFYKYKGDFPESFFYNQFMSIPGIGRKSAKSLFDAGIKSFNDLKNANDKNILSIPGIGPSALKEIRKYFETNSILS